MLVSPARSLQGTVNLPGDKSISHRAALLAAIADGTTSIENYAESADCASTLDCVAALGVAIERDENRVIVTGAGKHGLVRPDLPLDCGNSGTTMRLMSGILAGQPFESTLIGDESLNARPMTRVIEPLSRMGASIRSNNGRAPLIINGQRVLKSIEYRPPVASAQIKSCLLLAGLYAEGETTLVEAVATRDHTERMLKWFGAGAVERAGMSGTQISIQGDAVLSARDYIVPGDISAAAFFLVAAACMRDQMSLCRAWASTRHDALQSTSSAVSARTFC
jgi:3-phosphoshikimate 1-carboxyvinyltransferase